MIKYLEKYQKLPPNLRAEIANSDIISKIKELDERYHLDVNILVIRLMIKDLKFSNLINYLVNDLFFSREKAKKLKQDLESKIFPNLLDYLKDEKVNFSKQIDKKKEQSNVIDKSILASIPKANKQAEQKKVLKEVLLTPAPIVKRQTENKNVDNEVDSKIEKVINKTNLKFSSQFMETRFRQILKTYLKGIRNKIDTKATMVKPFDVGGLGLDEKSANNIISILDNANRPNQTKVKPPAKIKLPEDRRTIISADAKYNLKEAVKDKPILRKDYQNSKNLPTEFEKKFTPAELVVKNNVKSPAKKILKQKENHEKYKPIVKPVPKHKPIKRIQHTSSGKIKMDDIKMSPRVLTPVDELRYMNMRNFRNLNPNPERRTEIILEKLELFRKEDYAKKVAGIKAWRLSPVNKAYVNILKSSISNSVPIDTVINNQLKQNPNFMTKEEFYAIMALNKQLNY